MSLKPRCKNCKHRRGPRRDGPMAKSEGKEEHTRRLGWPRRKKNPCNCECHGR